MVLPSVLVIRPLIIAIVRPTCRTVLWMWIFVPGFVSQEGGYWGELRGKGGFRYITSVFKIGMRDERWDWRWIGRKWDFKKYILIEK